MHEWALAEAVLRSAEEVARKEGLSRIDELVVRMGELQQIDPESFDFALRQTLGKTKVRIEKESAVFRCRPCGREWSFADARKAMPADEAEFVHFVPEMAHTYLRCPKCSSPDFEIVRGRGVWLDRVVGERDEKKPRGS
ncbi:MAG: hydrogenase nickel incorporation protein HypA [Elusimicrobiota bacterium]